MCNTQPASKAKSNGLRDNVFWHNRFRIQWLARGFVAALGLSAILTLRGAAQSPASTDLAFKYHSIVPMGADEIRLQPSQQKVDLMASAESDSFEGVERRDPSHKVRLVDAGGSPFLYYPDEVSFRLTVSTIDKLKDQDRPLDIATDQDANTFLLNLHLRLKVFQGLDAYEIEPAHVELIGMPANIPYSERIYRATFPLNNIPSTARLMLEIFDSRQERISRFHLDLF